jgi:hypothetical protein
MKFTKLILIVLLAAIAFGGTFTCKDSNNDNSVTVKNHH